jgi:hypothetical protein
MLAMIDIGIDNALAFQMSGKITENDMQLILSNAKHKIETHGSIVILEKIDSFEGVEIVAVVEEFKYLFEVGMSNITKVAILTDEKWIAHIVSIEDKLFSNIEMKCFPVEAQLEAVKFLQST